MRKKQQSLEKDIRIVWVVAAIFIATIICIGANLQPTKEKQKPANQRAFSISK